MFKPELYGNTNGVPRKDSLECLEKFGSKMNWEEGCRVMDLGCGDGSVTAGVLRRFLPRGFQQLTGADISPEMVAHANATHGDQRTKFIVLDMTGHIPLGLAEHFDHVFSSYAIHWVHEQQKTFSNIYSMLREGGNCLLLFLGYTRVYDFYRALARHPRWQNMLRDADKYISPYQDMQEPDKQIQIIMENIGFNNICVDCENKLYVYEEDHFKNTMLAICPFKIPRDLIQEFMDDYMQAARDMGIVKQVHDKTFVNIEYTLITARGAK